MPTRRSRARRLPPLSALISMLASRGRLVQTKIVKDLYAPVIRIDDHHAIVAVDPEACGQLKLAESGALLSKVIKKISGIVEYLHHAANRFHHVEMSFGVDADSLRSEEQSAILSDAPDGVAETSGAVEHLHAEIHRVDHDQVVAGKTKFCWIIEFAIAASGLPYRLQNASLHVEDEHLIAQGVSDVNSLRLRIDRDARGSLEITFSALQAADDAMEFSAGFEDKDLARVRVGHINVVVGVDGNALRRNEAIHVAIARNEFVFLFFEIEDVNSGRPRIGNDDASVRILNHRIGTDQRVKVGSARNNVDQLVPEAALKSHIGLRPKRALKRQEPAAFEFELGHADWLRLGVLARREAHGPQAEHQRKDQTESPADATRS